LCNHSWLDKKGAFRHNDYDKFGEDGRVVFMSLFWVGRIVCWIIATLVICDLFPESSSKDHLSFFLLGVIGGDVGMFSLTLIITYIWVCKKAHQVRAIDVGLSIGRKELNQLWFGTNISLLPEFLSGILGAVTGLLAHLGFGWKSFGTFALCIPVSMISHVILEFVLVILVGVKSSREFRNAMSRNVGV
jgi:hypothetical protein